MKTASSFVLAALALALVPAAFAQSPKQRDAENLARFQRHASPPQPTMHYFHTDGFEYLGEDAQGEDAIAVWTGANTVYLLTLRSPCLNLDFANTIGLTSNSGEVNAGMDRVKYGHQGQQCTIHTIQQVDYKAVREDMARERSAHEQQP